MATLQPGSTNRYVLAPGETLTCTTDGTGAFRYGQLAAQPTGGASDVPAGSLIAVGASATVTIGPRADASRWLIDGVVGTCNVTQNLAQPIVQQSGAPADVVKLYGAGAPAASLGANHANTGSEYIDTTAGKAYINSGSKASPSWRIITSA